MLSIYILKTLCLTDINLVSMETVLSIVLPSCVVIPSSFHVLADCNCTDLAIYSLKGHNILSQCDLWRKSLKYNVYFFSILQEPTIRLGVLITWWSLYLWSALKKPKLPSRSGSYHLWSRWCPGKRRTPHYVEQNWWNIYYGKWLKDKKQTENLCRFFSLSIYRYIAISYIIHFILKNMHIRFCIELLQCFYMTVLASVFFYFIKYYAMFFCSKCFQ